MNDTAKADKVVFHLTGFGKFNGVPDNPTSRLMRELPVYLSQQRKALGNASRVASYTVLEVSAEGASDQLHIILNSGTTACGGTANGVTVYVHCGVDAGSTCFKLEELAYNEATFRVPDERGQSPIGVPVLPEQSNTEHSLRTTLPVAWIHERLCAAGWGNCVQRSEDAGRFVCNYVYYKSLAHCSSSGDKRSLFIHCPPLTVISEEDQRCFIKDCLIVIADACVKGITECPPPAAAPAAADSSDSDITALWGSRSIDSVSGLAPAPYEALLSSSNGQDSYSPRPVSSSNSSISNAHPLLPPQSDDASVEHLLSLQGDGYRSNRGSSDQRSRSSSPMHSSSEQQQQQQHQQQDDYEQILRRDLTPRTTPHATPRTHRQMRSGTSSVSMDSSIGPQPCKLLLLVRHDVGLSAGQIARQCVQASMRACRVVAEYDPEVMFAFERDGDQIITAVVDAEELQQVADSANSLGLPLTILTDAERGAAADDSSRFTIAAVGPAPSGILDELSSRLGRLA